MEIVNFSGEKRAEVGGSNSKILRNAGKIPAVLYGGGNNEHFTVTHKDVKKLIYTPDFKLGELGLDGVNHKCIIKAVQFHPVTDEIVHIDFLKLIDGTPVKVEIPVKYKGESPGVKEGGSLVPLMRKVKIKTKPEHLVNELFVDISNLTLGTSVRVRDLEVDDTMEVMSELATPIALVEVPRALRSAEAEAEDVAATPEAEGGEEAEAKE